MTSNVKAHTVSSYSDHQVGFWRKKQHPTVICVSTAGIVMNKSNICQKNVSRAAIVSLIPIPCSGMGMGDGDETIIHNTL